MSTYICTTCDTDFSSQQGLTTHQDDGCEWDDDETSTGPTYCCGMIYEEGESICHSCGEPV
ncbi:hypothetical protein [Streptomyces albidoflavus]|uniref:hypothetical protein n=1 Tax=Streptomyces albidoflavus TaxID=1886 RepID=UPI0033D9E9D3